MRIAGVKWWTPAIAATATLLAGLMLVPLAPTMPSEGLDPSWQYELNQALAQGLIFGRDLIFTFGPLGSAFTGQYHPASDPIMLLASALLATGFCAGFVMLVWPERLLLLALLPVVVAEAESPDARLMALPFLLLLCLVRIDTLPGSRLHLPLTPPIVAGLALLAAAMGILPLVKGSFLGVAGLDGAAAMFVALLGRRPILAALLIVIGLTSLCGGWVATGQPLTGLPTFFMAERHIISGYSEAMSLDSSVLTLGIWIAAAVSLSAGLFFGLRRTTRPIAWLTMLGLVGYLFIVYKAAFVRQAWHPRGASGTLLILALEIAALAKPRAGLALAIVAGLGWAAMERAAFHFTPALAATQLGNAVAGIWHGVGLRLSNPEFAQGKLRAGTGRNSSRRAVAGGQRHRRYLSH